MKAKLVIETLNEFHKTGDPLGALGLGYNIENAKALMKKDDETFYFENTFQNPYNIIIRNIVLRVANGQPIMDVFNDDCAGFFYNMQKTDYDRNMVLYRILTILKNDLSFAIDMDVFKKIENKIS